VYTLKLLANCLVFWGVFAALGAAVCWALGLNSPSVGWVVGGLVGVAAGILGTIEMSLRQKSPAKKSRAPASDYAELISRHSGYPSERYPPGDLQHWFPYSIRNPLWRGGCRTMVDVRDKLRSGVHIDHIGPIRRAICKAAVEEWEKELVKKTPRGA